MTGCTLRKEFGLGSCPATIEMTIGAKRAFE